MRFTSIAAVAVLAATQVSASSVFARQENTTAGTPAADNSTTPGAPAAGNATTPGAPAAGNGTTGAAGNATTPTGNGTTPAGNGTATPPGFALPNVPAACQSVCAPLANVSAACGNLTGSASETCICGKLTTTNLTGCFTCIGNASAPGSTPAEISAASDLLTSTLSAGCAAPGTKGNSGMRIELVGSALLAVVGAAAALL